jgi:Cof subfamily protein (haloacid dehalogenase superfamily)
MAPQGINIAVLIVLVVLLGNRATLGFCCWGTSRQNYGQRIIQSRIRSPRSLADNGLDNNDSERITAREDILQKLSGLNAFPMPSSRGGGSDPNGRPSKADLYDEADLGNLLNIHKRISSQTKAKKLEQDPASFIPSLHDLVLQATQGVAVTATENGSASSKSTGLRGGNAERFAWLTEDIQQKRKNISVIASDVDGTLLGSNQAMHPRTKSAVRRAVESAKSNESGTLKYFFPATGKTRWGALNSMGPETAALVSQCPGVFIQGLYCVDQEQNVIFEKKLPRAAVEATEALVLEYNASIVAYDGDDLYSTDLTGNVVDLHEIYGEPMSRKVDAVAGHPTGLHKLLVMDYDLDKVAKIRPLLEAMAEQHGACVTQAIPSMLEILPAGCSKALGVAKLCEALGVNPSEELLALGDAENDVGMLEMAAIGVAVGNGCGLAKKAADIVLDESNDEGGAGLAMEVLGGV